MTMISLFKFIQIKWHKNMEIENGWLSNTPIYKITLTITHLLKQLLLSMLLHWTYMSKTTKLCVLLRTAWPLQVKINHGQTMSFHLARGYFKIKRMFFSVKKRAKNEKNLTDSHRLSFNINLNSRPNLIASFYW